MQTSTNKNTRNSPPSSSRGQTFDSIVGMTENAIPVILGETASGKTSVGIELARLLKGEIISVDSRKVYRGLPIGTATPEGTWENGAYLVKNIPHHLMGHLPPDQIYTAGDFAKDADHLINSILARKKIPILVGGTGFYFKALEQGLPTLPPRDETIRADLSNVADQKGVAFLYSELAKVDPQAATSITHNDKHKIIRALEVFELTGQPFSAWKTAKKPITKRNFSVLGVRFAKDVVDKRIEERSAYMAEQGMIEETESALKNGFSPTCPALMGFGYREAVQVIQGSLPRSEFLPKLIQGTKAYAKRQRTWFRTQIKPLWFECDDSSRPDQIAMKMKAFLSNSQT